MPPVDSASSAPELLRVWAEPAHDGAALVVHAEGDIDLASVGDLREQLLTHVTAARHAVVVDLTATTFLAGCGLSLFDETATRATADGVGLWLVAPASGPVRRALDICDFDNVIPRAETVEDALEHYVREGKRAPWPTS